MRLCAAFCLLSAVTVTAACGSHDADPAMTPKGAADAPAARATFALQTRDYKVTFLTGDRLLVADARGAIVARDVTVDELEKVDAFLYAACRNAMATAGARGPYLDARLDRFAPSSDDRSPTEPGAARR